MSEWWTYSLTSFLLFSARTYYRLFELYNLDVWPLQVATLALGVAILVIILRAPAWGGRAVSAILGGLWLLVAWAYHLERYDPINFAARYYAMGFALQAALLIWTGVIRNGLTFQTPLIPAKAGIQNNPLGARSPWAPVFTGVSGAYGLALLAYALLLHPLIPLSLGRPWTQGEVFGPAPDPTAIGTIGILLTIRRLPWHLLTLPLLWCIVTGLTLWTMEQPEAPLVPILAILAVLAATWKTRTSQAAPDG